MLTEIKWDAAKIKNILMQTVRILLFAVVPILLFYLMEAYEHDPFQDVRPTAHWLNIALFELIALVFFFLFGSARIALRVETVIALLYGLINHYVMAFRSTPFVPWDIFSVRTAASVVGNYDLTPTANVIKVTICFVLIFVILQFLELKFPYGFVLRIIPMLCVTLVLGGFVGLLQDSSFQTQCNLYPYLFTPSYMTKVNGMAVTFAMDMAYVFVEKPAGYSPAEAEEILSRYESSEGSSRTPNVIAIMDEAFSDLAVLGDFTPSEDYMPFIHSLQKGSENTITGMLTVSVCGGNTANSEFEFLTGHTMDFFPVGSIPYQQYIKGEMPSLASQLREKGYLTWGMHPYGATGWCRDKVYPWIGFDHTAFIKNFQNKTYIRDYVSDATAFDKIISTFESKEDGQPLFLFEVTMQNHGSYSDLYENFTPFITVEGVKNNALEQYLSLIRVTDQELERLVEYFSDVEEETILVFFGDHQPNDYVANRILKLSGKSTSTLTWTETLQRYQVPYVIWANFDIEEATDCDMDISFLASHVLQAAGMELTPYQNFLLELEEVIAANDGSKEAEEKEAEYLLMYQKLQYYYMFDYEEESVE